jgi:hypothetical protein
LTNSPEIENIIEQAIAFAKERQYGSYRVSNAQDAGATGAAEFAGIAAGKFKLRLN